jgi:ubiquitin-protein ligase
METKARKIAYRHWLELRAEPIPGVSMHLVDMNTFHVNTRVLDGPYIGLIVHWILTIPDSYPQAAPFGHIAPGYYFNERHHHHVFSERGICTDFLANFPYMTQSASAGSGWTPACNFIGLMVNMQAFFADPDFGGCHVLSKTERELLFARNDAYACAICGHSTAVPFPPLATVSTATAPDEVITSANAACADDSKLVDKMQNVTISPEAAIRNRARSEWLCSVRKTSPIDDATTLLGSVGISTTNFQFSCRNCNSNLC